MQQGTKRVIPLPKRRWYNILKSGMQPLNFVPVLLFLLQVIAVIICIVSSYHAKGQGGIVIGIVGVAAVISSIAGIVVSVKGLKKRKTEKFWSWIGLAAHLVFLIVMIGIFDMGVISLIG